jgi:hypothetical protein
MATRSPPRASAAIVGISSGSWSFARQCSDSSTGRNPQSASTGVMAQRISGLWYRSLKVRVGSSIGMPAASSAAKPASAWAVVGCACRDSGMSAASTFIRKGSRSPNRACTAGPSSPSGSARMALSSGRPSESTLGSPGWAPIHSSACGSAAGDG